MKLNEINIRDPFVLPVGGKYYMYGTRGSKIFGYAIGFDVFVSEDLENWSEPHSPCFTFAFMLQFNNHCALAFEVFCNHHACNPRVIPKVIT